MSSKILVVTPKMPFPKSGADEQDRGYGIEDLVRLGYQVRVITKAAPEKVSRAAEESKRLGVTVTALPYLHGRGQSLLSRLLSPRTWDGAANEYFDPAMREALRRELDAFQPDLVWFDYTYLWPLYDEVKKRGIPIITRSINWEPAHFLGEDGITPINLLKYLPKLFSEIRTIRKSDLILSITPREEAAYRKRGANVRNLPLRGLPHVLRGSRTIADKRVLDVFFFGSTYNVHHNRHALEFLLREIVPLVRRKAPGRFMFHILGSKIPADLEQLRKDDVRYEGYVPDLDAYLEGMDSAVIPSFIGAFGMQGKIFEPLARGIPMIASPRGIAGYPFSAGEHYLAADNAQEFADSLVACADIGLRRKLSANALALSQRLFSQQAIDAVVTGAIDSLIARP